MKLAAIALTTGLLVGWWFTGDHYRGRVEQLQSDVTTCIDNNHQLEQSVTKQNNAILALRIAANQRAVDYAQLIAAPEKERFNIRYVEIKSDECTDVKTILDDIRATGF